MNHKPFLQNWKKISKSVKLNAYADNEQLYASDIDPAELDKRILHDCKPW